MHARQTEHETLVEMADEEYRVTRQVSTGNGDRYVAQWRPMDGFHSFELGYKSGEGPSLELTIGARSTAEAIVTFAATANGLSPLANQHRLAPVPPPPAPAESTRRRKKRSETRWSRKAKRENKYERYAAIADIERSAMQLLAGNQAG